MNLLLESLPLTITSAGAVLVAWLNRRKIIEVHTLVNGDRTARTAELADVTEKLAHVTEKLAVVEKELATLRATPA